MNCTKCNDTGSLSKSVYGERDCHHCGRADENTRVLAWFKSVNQGDGDADMLNLYYHGVAAGVDLQRLRIMELENEIAENRKKLRGFSLKALTAAAQEMGCAAPAQQESAPAPAALTDEQIAVAVRPLYADDHSAQMGLVDDIKTAHAVLKAIGAAPAEQARDADKVLTQLESVAALLPGILYMDGDNVLLIEQFRRMGVDAARYRHLRQEMPGCMRDVGISRACDFDFWLDGASADSYIDAAIASQQKGGV